MHGKRQYAVGVVDVVEHTPGFHIHEAHETVFVHHIVGVPVFCYVLTQLARCNGHVLCRCLLLFSLVAVVGRWGDGGVGRCVVVDIILAEVALVHNLLQFCQIVHRPCRCSFAQIILVVGFQHDRRFACCHLDGINVMFACVGVFDVARHVDGIAESLVYAVAHMQVILVAVVAEELEVFLQASCRSCVLHAEVDCAAVRVGHAADYLHHVECLLFDVGTHVVVWGEHDRCLKLSLLCLFAERVDLGKRHVDVEQTLYLCHHSLLIVVERKAFSQVVAEH